MNRDVTLTTAHVTRVVDVVRAVDPEDSDLLVSMIQGETEFEPVLWNLCEAHDAARVHVDTLDQRIRDMKERKDRLVRQMDAAKAGTLALLDATGQRRWQLAEWTPHIRETESVKEQPDADVNLLPDDCVKVERKVIKGAVNDAIKAGRNIPGYCVERVRSVAFGRK